MRRNCTHCGVDQVVADEKLTAGWVFLKCHHCSATSALQGKASLRLIQISERPVRSPAKPAKMEEPRVEFIKPVLTNSVSSKPTLALPPVPEFLKAERTGKIEKNEKVSNTQQIEIPAEIKAVEEPVEPLLFEPERPSAPDAQPVPILLEEEKAPHPFYESAKEFAKTFPQTASEYARNVRPYALPLALAIVCFGSGGYLLKSAKQIREGALLLPIQNPVTVASDMAPSDEPASPVAASQAQPAALLASSAQTAAAQAVAQSQVQVHTQPARAPASQPSEEKVQVLAASAVLRAGPGTHYNKVGTARAELQLLVKGSFDNWIEVRTGGGNKTAWIRNDLVKTIHGPIQKVARQEAQP